MYLEIFLADFAEILEFRGSATARNIRSPAYNIFVWKRTRNRGVARGGFQGFRKPPLAPRNPPSLIFNSDFIPARV